jgi:hypothetical protein
MADNKYWGVVAQFENPARLVEAIVKVREAGYADYECWSPFPIHGIERAMGLEGSKVPWVTLAGALSGLSLATWLQWWTGAVAYPVVIGGKPLFAIEPAVPIMFELTILLSAFGTLFGMLILNGLPRPHHPIDTYPAFRSVTDDGFFISIETTDPKFDPEESKALLASLGGTNIALVEA